MYKLITDGKLLSKEIAATGQLYASAHKRLHAAAVSAIWFAAKHGQIGPLNQLYAFLKTNDQSALKNYIRRSHSIVGLSGENPDGKEKEIVQAAIEQGTVIGFADKQFNIKRGHNTIEAQTLAKLAESRFINPDEKKGDREVFDRNVLSEVMVLTDREVLTRFIAMVKEMDGGDTERRKVAVSEKTKKLFRPLAGQADVLLQQLSLTSPVASSDEKPKELKATRKPRASKKAAAAKASATTSPVQTVN